MGFSAAFDRLSSIMPPDRGEKACIDWTIIRGEWGSGLPQDYVRFIGAYGAGSIDDYLGVASPTSSNSPGTLPIDLVSETEEARDVFRRNRQGLPAFVGAESLIAWAHDSSSDLLCWIKTGDDPDSWPVAVWATDDGQWSVYEFGMVEFLVAIFDATLDECPLGDTSLWGKANPKFVSWADQVRLRESGTDPWTGGPLPHFDEFGG
ncbi:hypothetical protein OG500_07720 [Kitasatospora sp. NBC_01250]|uniref:hypothetical protein n=1 Tax=Kitasatospora sp. NBC_01250 TaxID=2903571 RepID=UPI002E34E7C5|nr:hypothetical protein [Kitasatospora sp. NBC_01250]